MPANPVARTDVSLRTRLALALAAIAGLSIVAVGSIGYAGTAHELHRQLDASLFSYAGGLADPDGRAISSLCSNRSAISSDEEHSGRLVAGLPGASIECIGADGTVGNWISESETPPAVPAELARQRTVGVSGAVTVPVGRQAYRFVTVTAADGSKVRVGWSLAEVDKALDSIRARALGAGALVIVVAALGRTDHRPSRHPAGRGAHDNCRADRTHRTDRYAGQRWSPRRGRATGDIVRDHVGRVERIT